MNRLHLNYFAILIITGMLFTSCKNNNSSKEAEKTIEKTVETKEVVTKVEKHPKPEDFGVSSKAYRIAETNFNILRSLKKAPINKFSHKRIFSDVKTQQVIREQQDVLYSSAVVDISKGATITLPKYDNYNIIQVIDMQNYSIKTIYPGESATITLDDVSYGNYVYLNARIRPISTDKKGMKAAHAQQDKYKIEAKSAIPYKVPADIISDEKMNEARAALITGVKQGGIKHYMTMMGTQDHVTKQDHLYATAYGWGGLPAVDAMYIPISVKSNGSECSSITLAAPPIDPKKHGFWSITVYNTEGWLTVDKASINGETAKPNEDGTYTMRFNCADKENSLVTEENFAVLLRIYAPTSAKAIEDYIIDLKKNREPVKVK